jgi:NAD(P)-dependent dehydrogenase (short-subunit alcohol dehydrogenase family)
MNQLADKVAIVTGGASGMGRATTLLFAQEGAKVVVADLNEQAGAEVAALASETGNACVFQKTDVTSEPDMVALIDRAVSKFGRLDILINNAGITGARGVIETLSLEGWEKTVAVNLRGVFLGIKHAIAPMRKAGGGAIVSTASLGGLMGFPLFHPYCAAKAGVISMTRSASMELAKDLIRVNCVAPGGISTPMSHRFAGVASKQEADEIYSKIQPLPYAGQPEDIANSMLFLASDASRFITGHTLVVDGGAHAGKESEWAPEMAEEIFAGPSFQ